MAPRKSAAAGKDDPCPMLKLIMEKGPLSGQTHDFRPGSRIRIGRVVRGNTLAIKDAGVSSKHLLIQVEPGSGTGCQRWTITDLGSSNGTFLNGVRLEESEAAELSDGDVIIIGEQTSIKVKFEVNCAENEVGSRNVRSTRRRGKNEVWELVAIAEDSELGLGVGSENNLGDGFRNEKYEDLGNEAGGLGTVGEEKVRGRRTRGSVVRELEDGGEEVQVKVQSLGKVMRRTRNSKEEKSESSTIKLDVDYEKSDKVDEIEVKQGRNVNIRARRSKNAENMLDDLNGNRDNDLGTAEVQGRQRGNVRRTRSSRKEENVGETELDLGVVEAKKTRAGGRGRKKLPAETPLEEQEKILEHKICEEEKRESEVGVNELVEEVNSGREGAAGLASTSGVKEGGADVGKGKAVVDLEKMTLGEWFDFLEVFLPKQIIDETEEMISEMRQKADRLHEYMLQQKKAKDKVEVAVD
ncbi:FHA domain-containing protein At4g14490 [Sesamum indicum]|uniref:FHA domain-containing protein At4g14490 n=1 Tax=Sesamum indicum TaxID=4182 RepID=A0A6I9T074_SESIN|nr:FHA domain-containing protein At4g14490 [Sesamum indicum]